MNADTNPYRQALLEEVPSYVDDIEWPTPRLTSHIKDMLAEKETANGRRASTLERQLGHACFELTFRRQELARLDEQFGQPPAPREAVC